jgi:tetratricopeptide (TPR) repeat protein
MKGQLATPPECYLQRAINYSKRDFGSYAMYAYYLNKKGLKDKAASLYQKALKISPDNPKIEYSYSLLLLELNQKEEALEIAKKIYAKGSAPDGLKKKLIKLGMWK